MLFNATFVVLLRYLTILGGLLMEIPSAQFANSKYTKMLSTVIHVHTPKVRTDSCNYCFCLFTVSN